MEECEREACEKQWSEYIKACYSLTWCNNYELSKEVTDTIEKLISLVPRVMDDKIRYTKLMAAAEARVKKRMGE